MDDDISETVSSTDQDKQFIDLIHSNISRKPSRVENDEATKTNLLRSTSQIDNLLLDEEAEFISVDQGHRDKLSDERVDPLSVRAETKIEDLLLKDEADLMEFIMSRPKNDDAKGGLPSTSSERKKDNSLLEHTKLISVGPNVRGDEGDVVSSAEVKNKENHRDVELISIDSDDENEEDHPVGNKLPCSSEIKKVDSLDGENDLKFPDVNEPSVAISSHPEIPLNELSSSVAGNVSEKESLSSNVDEEVESDEALFVDVDEDDDVDEIEKDASSPKVVQEVVKKKELEALFVDVDEDDDVDEIEKDASSPKAVQEVVKKKELLSNKVDEEVKDDESLFIEIDEDDEKDERSLKQVDEVLSSEEDKDVKEDEFLVVDEDGKKDQRSLEKDGKMEEIPQKEVDEDSKNDDDENSSMKVNEGVEKDEALPLSGVDNLIPRNELVVSRVDEVEKGALSLSGQGSFSTDNQNHLDEPTIPSNSSNSEAPRPELHEAAGVSNPVVENLNLTNDSSNSESPRLRIRLPKKNWRAISPNSSLLESEPLIKRRASLRSRERSSSYVDTSNDDGIDKAFRNDKHYSGSVSDDILDSDMQDVETANAPVRHPRNPYGRKGDPNKKKNKKHGKHRHKKNKKAKQNAAQYLDYVNQDGQNVDQNGEQSIVNAEQPEQDTSQTVEQAKQKRVRNVVGCPTKEEWLKPFDYGWRRELVYRNVGKDGNPCSKVSSDVYYFAPDGKKLRSTPMISQYLIDHKVPDLTEQCFTFLRQIIYHEPLETVRDAGRSRGKPKPEPVVEKPAKKRGRKKKFPKIKVFMSEKPKTPEEPPESSAINFDSSVTEELGDTVLDPPLLESTTIESRPAETSTDQDVAFPGFAVNLSQDSSINASDFTKLCDKLDTVSSVNETSANETSLNIDSECPSTVITVKVNSNSSRTRKLAVKSPVIKNKNLELSGKKEVGSGIQSQSSELSRQPLAKKHTGKKRKLMFESDKAVGKKIVCVEKQTDETKVDEPNDSAPRVDLPEKIKQKPFKPFLKPISKPVFKPVFKPKIQDERSLSEMGSQIKKSRPSLCGLSCAGQHGVPPSLSCGFCMCMFHPECVGLQSGGNNTFTCKACMRLNEELQCPPYFYDNQSSSVMADESSSVAPQSIETLVQRTRPIQHSPNFSSPSAPSTSSVLEILGTITSRPPAPEPTLPEPVHVSLENLNPAKITGQVLSFPRSMFGFIDVAKPLTLRIKADQKFIIPPNCFSITANAVRILLPHNQLSETAPEIAQANPPTLVTDQSLSVAVQNLSPKIHVNVDHLVLTSPDASGFRSPINRSANSNEPKNLARNSCERSPNTTIVATEKARTSQEVSDVDKRSKKSDDTQASPNKDQPTNACLKNINCLRNFFQFLTIRDLLRVVQVCKIWKMVAEYRPLWYSVNLRGIKVQDWDVAASCLTRHQTHDLNLIGLEHYGSQNQTWHQLTAAMSNLSSIRCLEFGPCPANLLYAAADKMPHLESLVAESIMDMSCDYNTTKWFAPAKLDPGKFASLQNMSKLRLRGIAGLLLPAFSKDGGIMELGELSALQHLSITALKEIHGREFNFLGRFERLKVLEIGDCTLWERETFEQVSKLVGLRKLRLEVGGSQQCSELAAILPNLKNLDHLDVFQFVINEDIVQILVTLSNLKTLSVCPAVGELLSLSNTNLMTALKQMTFLKHVEWGVYNQHCESETPDFWQGDEAVSARIPFFHLDDPDRENKENKFTRDLSSPSSSYFLSVDELEQTLKTHLPETVFRIFEVEGQNELL